MTISIQLTEAQIAAVQQHKKDDDQRHESRKYLSVEDISMRLQHLRGLRREHLYALTFDRHQHIIQSHEVSIGTVDATLVHPREVFRPALLDCANGLVVVHNHPSEQTDPSEDDCLITHRLVAAGKILGIELIDHIIIGRNGFYSFRQDGRIEGTREAQQGITLSPARAEGGT